MTPPQSPTPDERPCILVVDDEPGPRESLRVILEPAHRVLTAESAAAALELLRGGPDVDVVTVDLNMPGMRGEELARTLRADFPWVEVVVITGCGSLDSATEAVRLGICDYLEKPFDVVVVAAALARAVDRRRSRTRLAGFLTDLGEVLGRDRDVATLVGDLQRSHKLRGRLGDLFSGGSWPTGEPDASPARTLEFLEVLAETIESKDRFMRGHARRVALTTSLLADRLQLGARERDEVRLAAFLHDLGKVALPNEVLERPGALAPPERQVVEQHPALGARLLRPLEIAPSVAAAVRHHHEWWDGTGYPDGLAGEDIPLAARLVAVADAWDAMRSDRPYRRALDPSVAAAELRRFAGSQFDPAVALAFVEVIESGVLDTGPDFFRDVALAPRSAAAPL